MNTPQIDAMEIIDSLSVELAAAVKRAVIAETRALQLEALLNDKENQ